VIEAALDGMVMLLSVKNILLMFVGIFVGLVFGTIPGLSGQTALAVLLPFTLGMDPATAMALLIGAHVAVEYGGSISAILINTPGTGQAIATCWDGYPMAQKGEAARALSISATSSALGGLVGFVVLVGFIPIMKITLMAIASPEYFIASFVGLTFIVVLGGGSLIKALISGGLGLMLAFVGLDPITSAPRFTFGQLYLWDGISLVPIVVGLFAFPEVATLMARGETIARIEMRGSQWGLIWQGVKDTFSHWRVLLQCSALGVVIGILPGLGGTVANLAAYGLASRTSPERDKFGQGAIDGILAPESANNSKEGGDLIPTIALGIPGGAGMAILLGAFVIVGLAPGPDMLTTGLKHTFAIAWILAVANLLTTAIGLLFCAPIARLSFLPIHILTPMIVAVCLVGVYLDGSKIENVFLAVGFGLFGYLMRRAGYPRPPLIIGVVLGRIVERYLHMSLKLYGPLFFVRPISIFLIAIIVVTIAAPTIYTRRIRGDAGVAR
jgi:putative tricarboxylic transport membrane protein